KYEFDGPQGKVSLLDLFEGRRQLIVYRAFFEPGVFGWPEHACRGCSLGADQVADLAHLNARDTTLAYASRAPLADIARLTAPRPRLTRSGSRCCPTLESRLPKATQRRKRAKKERPLRRLRAAGSLHTGTARVLRQSARSMARRRSWRTAISSPSGKDRR